MRVQVELVGFLASTGLPGGFTGGMVELPTGAMLAGLLEAIGVHGPGPWLVTRNGALLGEADVLQDNDLLRFIPPISGGSKQHYSQGVK